MALVNGGGGDSVPHLATLFEDDHYIVIDKPAGVMVHEDGVTTRPTVVSWVRAYHPECIGVGEPQRLYDGRLVDRPGIVHRLDVETTGVLVIAKHQTTFLHLKEQFKRHEVQKAYHAFVHGVVSNDEGVIHRPIGRASRNNGPPRWSAHATAKGVLRDAVTMYNTLMRSTQATLVELRPQTGRTHQLRVHMHYIHHPLVGDTLYAPKRPFLLGFTRLALHAASIVFTDPAGNERVVIAPYPPDFVRAHSELSLGVL